MGRGRPKKCLICGKAIVDEEGMPYKGRYVHSSCFNIGIKAITMNKQDALDEAVQSKKEKKKKEKTTIPKAEKLQDAMSEEEYKDKQNYYSYLKKLIGNEIPAKVYPVTKRYIDQYGFTYQKMYQTLVYLNEILEKDLKGDVIGVIPYYYNEAVHYYEDLKRIEKNSQNINDLYKEKIVYINPRLRKNRTLNIESIGN